MTTVSTAVVASFTPPLEQARESIVTGIAPGAMVFVGPLNAATSDLAGMVN